MVEIQQSKDVCIDILRTDSGPGLELMSNLRTSDQVLKVLEGYLCKYLRAGFGVGETETLLRTSVGWQAKGRDGIENIGKGADYSMQGWQTREVDL